MAYKDLRLTKTGGIYDLKLTNGKFEWATEGTAIAQSVLVRLRRVFGESRFSRSMGLKLYEIILQPDKGRAEKELEFKRVILGTPGVESIESFTWTHPAASQTVSIECGIITEYGAATVSGVVTPL